MRRLLTTLSDYDPGMLEIIANRWDVDIQGLDKREAAEALAEQMIDPETAAAEWARLNDPERGALQTLLSTPEYRMPEAHFTRIFGEIRQMGPGRRDREKPHLHPVSVAETLYFRGLITIGFDQGKTGGQQYVYVPAELAEALPAHETGFDLEAEEDVLQLDGDYTPENILQATTALVDDMTTMLAFLQIAEVPADRDVLRDSIDEALATFWLGEIYPSRTALLLSLAGSLGLAASDDGKFKPIPSNARAWLEQTRPRQVRALAEGWRTTTLFNDLWHTPSLLPEDTGWRNDPLLARQTVLTFLEMVPPEGWWPVTELVQAVKEDEPDFQRPGGDYDSWYIRDADSGDYLRGFESWDRVDGGVLWFILTGPMHWLGLIDLANDGQLCRLTAYGRALVGQIDWPDPPEERATVTIEGDGMIHAPRLLSRYERFQLARITDWRSAGDPYIFAFTARGLARAAQQGIRADAISAFLKRASGADLPPVITKMLTRWEQTGGAEAKLSHAVILQAPEETIKMAWETPELRRFFSKLLGPGALLVRPGDEQTLVNALQQLGILVELAGFDGD